MNEVEIEEREIVSTKMWSKAKKQTLNCQP